MSLQPVINDPEATRHPNPGGERPADRIDDVLDALRVYWHANPDLRLGQIINSLAYPVDPRFIEDHYLIARLAADRAPGPGAIRYTIRTAKRGARRQHIYRDVLTDPATGAYVGSALCKGTEDQHLTGAPHWPVDPIAHLLPQSLVSCDRCWSAYDRIVAYTPPTTTPPTNTPPTNTPLGSTS